MTTELKTVLQHAGSVLVGQLAVMAFGVADTLIAGRYSDAALAALAVGSALYISVYVGLIGVVQAMLPVWAEMMGRGQQGALGASLRQSLYLVVLMTGVGMLALLFPGPLLRWAEVPPDLLVEVQRYLAVLAFAVAPALLFRIYAAFNQALGKPLMVTWLQVGALGVKIPLSVWLVAGGAGIEPMGAVGCAWATLIVNYFLMVLSFVMLRTQKLYQPFKVFEPMERPPRQQIAHFARLGLPAGLSYLVEATSFTLMALFIARLGTVSTASHQIAASIAGALYMLPLSVGIAGSARASFWLGAGQPERAKHVVYMCLRLTALVSITCVAIICIARSTFAGWYSSNPEIVALAATLLLWVAVYHVADSVQAVSAFLLRCYGITLTPLLIYGVLLWALGLAGGYRLTYHGIAGLAAMPSALSFWMASTLAIVMAAVCLCGMVIQAARRRGRNVPGNLPGNALSDVPRGAPHAEP